MYINTDLTKRRPCEERGAKKYRRYKGVNSPKGGTQSYANGGTRRKRDDL